MKKFFTGVTITMIIAAVFLLLGTTNAQNRFDSNLVKISKHATYEDDIKVNVKVMLNDEYTETDEVVIKIKNNSVGITHTITINQDFTVFFRYDTEYTITFSHKGFYSRVIHINTECPKSEIWVIDLTMRLYNDREAPNAGYIYYNKDRESFETSLIKQY